MDLKQKGGAAVEKMDIYKLESRLQAAMQPVSARPDFVNGLRQQLLATPEISLQQPSPGLLRSFVLASAGLLSGTILLVLQRRITWVIR
jgi:hypothetical protein